MNGSYPSLMASTHSAAGCSSTEYGTAGAGMGVPRVDGWGPIYSSYQGTSNEAVATNDETWTKDSVIRLGLELGPD